MDGSAGPSSGTRFRNDLPDIAEYEQDHISAERPGVHKRGSGRWSINSYPSFGGQGTMGRPQSMHFFDPGTLNSMEINHNRYPHQWPSPPQKPSDIVAVRSEEEQEKKGPSVLLIMSLFMSVFLSALDITIITTALPTIADEMGTNATGFTWIGSAYLLAGGASEPIWAKLSDIFGRKPVLLLANIIFLGGSVICALSKTIGVLIMGRVTQGLGSGGLLCLVNVLIGDLFSPRKRGAYYGLLGLVWAVANAIGPLLGGLFSDKMSWQWCFWVNVPCDGIALILTTLFLKVHTPHTPFWEGICAIDWLGSLSIVGGTIMLLLGLEFGGITFPWGSAAVISLIVSGILLWVAFFFVEAYVPKYPLIPLNIFSNVSNMAIIAVDFCHGFVFIAGSYFLPVYFQGILGASPLMSGIYLFPFVISLSVAAVATGQIISRTGAYLPLISLGMLFMTLGFTLFIDLPPEPSWPRIVLYQIIAGLGVGPNFQAPMLALQNSVKPYEIGAATGAFGFVRQLANAMSLVFGGIILQNQLKNHRAELVAAGIETRIVNYLTTDGMAVTMMGQINFLPKYQREVARDVFTASLQKAWILYAAIGIIGLGLTDFIRRKALSDEHEETETGLAQQERARQDRLAEKVRSIGVLPDPGNSPEPWLDAPPHRNPAMSSVSNSPPILARAQHQTSEKSAAAFAAKSDGFGNQVSHIEEAVIEPPQGFSGEGAIRGARRRSYRERLSGAAGPASFRHHTDADNEEGDYHASAPVTPSAPFPPASEGGFHSNGDWYDDVLHDRGLEVHRGGFEEPGQKNLTHRS